MTKSSDNVKKYIAKGVPSFINSGDYDTNELLQIARTAKGCGTMLTISVASKTPMDTFDLIVDEAKGYIQFDYRD